MAGMEEKLERLTERVDALETFVCILFAHRTPKKQRAHYIKTLKTAITDCHVKMLTDSTRSGDHEGLISGTDSHGIPEAFGRLLVKLEQDMGR